DVGANNTGLTSVYVDATFCGAAKPLALHHGDRFIEFSTGSISSAGIDEFGGSKLPQGGGKAPEWVRVGWIEATAGAEAAACRIQLLPSSTGVAAFTRGLVPPWLVDLGAIDLRIAESTVTYDLDGDGNIGVGDLSIFAGSWLESVPPAL